MADLRKAKALFLHGGPGLNTAAERLWFGDTLPIHWWDQPASAEASPTPFSDLVAAALDELESLSEAAGGPVAIVAHSFGGQIAVALARAAPQHIRAMTLLGCPPEPSRPFLHLARRLLAAGYPHPGLEAALAQAQAGLDEARFFALVNACFPGGNFPDLYFGPGSTAARERFLALAPSLPPLDMATFAAVMRDRLQATELPPVTGFTGKVAVVLGRHDPVLSLDEDVPAWRRILPQAEIRVHDVGHITHLELPADLWWDE